VFGGCTAGLFDAFGRLVVGFDDLECLARLVDWWKPQLIAPVHRPGPFSPRIPSCPQFRYPLRLARGFPGQSQRGDLFCSLRQAVSCVGRRPIALLFWKGWCTLEGTSPGGDVFSGCDSGSQSVE